MKLIDADEFFKSFESEENPEDSLWTLYGIKRKIEDAPTQEPKTGHWIEVDTNMYSCSSCGHCFTIVPEDNNIKQFKYCPNCEVKMVEPQESEDKE